MSEKELGDCCPECKVGVEQGRDELFELAEALGSRIFDRYRSVTAKPLAPRKFKETYSFALTHDGKADDRVVVEKPAGALFRGEKLMMFVTPDGPRSVRVHRMEVGGKLQFGGGGAWAEVWAEDFPVNSLACGISFSIAKLEDKVLFEIEFFKDCKWVAHLLGPVAR